MIIKAVFMGDDWALVTGFDKIHTAALPGGRGQGQPSGDDPIDLAQTPLGQILMYGDHMFGIGLFDQNSVEYIRISSLNTPSTTSKIAGCAAMSWAIGITTWALTRLYTAKGRGRSLLSQSRSIPSSSSRQVLDCAAEIAGIGKR